jgi:hypothetical protein
MSLSNHGSVARIRRLVCVLTAVAVATAACAGLHHVPLVAASPGQPAVWQVKPGDTVRVAMRNGSSFEFRVQSVTPDAIVSSDGARFESNDIRSVERSGFSGGKTAAAVGAGIGVTAAVALVLGVVVSATLISAVLGGGGGPD